MNYLWPLCSALLLLPIVVGASTPLTLNYGVNTVDINADGLEDYIIRSRWENMNAHSFDRYFIMIQLEDEHRPERFYEVPLGDGHRYEIRTEEGLGCLYESSNGRSHLADYQWHLDGAGWLKVTHYQRPYGETYGSSLPLTMTHYQLVYGPDENEGWAYPGIPLYYLKQVGQRTTEQAYCNVWEYIER